MKRCKIRTTGAVLFAQAILLIILGAFFKIIPSAFFQGGEELNRRTARAVPRKTKQEIQDLYVPVGRAEGLAVDWLSGNIYWTDAKKRVIEVASKDGYYRYTLFSGRMNMPHALVLDPPAGLVLMVLSYHGWQFACLSIKGKITER